MRLDLVSALEVGRVGFVIGVGFEAKGVLVSHLHLSLRYNEDTRAAPARPPAPFPSAVQRMHDISTGSDSSASQTRLFKCTGTR